MNSRGIIVVLIAAGLCAAGPARAFKRSRDADTGVCLYLTDSSATYYINENCSSDIPNVNDCITAMRAAFDAWSSQGCTDLSFPYGGTTDRTDVGFDQDHWSDNINLVIFQEGSWSHDASAIALTTTTYDVDSGEIVDFDIEFNGVNFSFSTSDSQSLMMDIQNTISHEVGHAMGLDHSRDPSATMYATASPGEKEKRTLSQDDIDALCFVYPADGETPGFTDDSLSLECKGKVSSGGGCDSAGGEGEHSYSCLVGWLLLAAAGLELLRMRFAKERRSLK